MLSFSGSLKVFVAVQPCDMLTLVVSTLSVFANAEFTGPQMFSPGYYVSRYPELKTFSYRR